MYQFSCVGILLFSSHLLSTVCDTQSIRVLAHHASPDVCIVCDLDNTLVRPAGILGSDEWFTDFLSQCSQHPFSDYVRILIHLFEEIQHRVSLVQLEKDSHDILLFCVDSGARIIGMTARSCRLQNRTVEQLATLSLDFSTSSGLQDQNLGDSRSIYSGIVFCNGGNKAEMFRKLADAEGYRPSMLIVIDDRRDYLAQFKLLCDEWGISCLLYHYRGADSFREWYSRTDAVQELKKFIAQYPEVAESALIICAAFGMVEFSHPY